MRDELEFPLGLWAHLSIWPLSTWFRVFGMSMKGMFVDYAKLPEEMASPSSSSDKGKLNLWSCNICGLNSKDQRQFMAPYYCFFSWLIQETSMRLVRKSVPVLRTETQESLYPVKWLNARTKLNIAGQE